MKPTFNESGDIVLVDHISAWRHRLKKDDVVIAVSPLNPRQTVCKRLKALEGETVDIKRRRSHASTKSVTLPKGRVWLEGDNPSNSTDSRAYGPVPYAMLKGRVFFKLWPLNEFGAVK